MMLTRDLSDPTRRSRDLLSVISDDDNELVVFGLTSGGKHVDENVYRFVRDRLLQSSDVHVQIAAVHTVGSSSLGGNANTILTDIVASATTSRNSPFSKESLSKRAALEHVDMGEPQTFALVLSIAQDEGEDPGVRAKAISRCNARDYSEADEWLLPLLDRTPADDAVVLSAVVEALLSNPTSERLKAIRTRCDIIEDRVVHALIEKRVQSASEINLQ
jgi:hypothetical protein